MTYKTEQENFWAGKFGDEYIDRNIGKKLTASNLDFSLGLLEERNPSITALSLVQI